MRILIRKRTTDNRVNLYLDKLGGWSTLYNAREFKTFRAAEEVVPTLADPADAVGVGS